MADLIDRQAAIDKLQKEINKGIPPFDDVMGAIRCGVRLARNIIEDLPSAQQQRILYANMSDAEFEKWLYEHGICNPNIHESIPCDVVPLLIDYAISEPPSAQPQRKKGKWIKLDMHAHIADHKCTACGQECYVPTCMGEPMYAYCPNCGARME